MFSNASNFVHGVDLAFFIITGISLFFLITLTAMMIFFVVKYNKKKGIPAVQIKNNSLLEITWITIPMILVLYMFYIGWEGFIPMRQAPKDAMEVKAIGQMWKWTFEYKGNKQSDTLVLPIHKAVKVNLISKDVLHGFFIPSFRIKEDVVPQKNNYSWFIPGELGDFDLYCTVYCGVNHSFMTSIVRIVSQNDYDKWLATLNEKKPDIDNKGYKVLEKNGCFTCHTKDGGKSVGPSFESLYGSTIEVATNGTSRKLVVDSAYIVSSIIDPNKDIAVGYPQGIMKSYKGIVKEEEFKLINDYLKSIK